MRRIIIAVTVCLFLSIFSFQAIKAQEEIEECVEEPTDQIIQYGNFLDGSNCGISPVGDRDIFRFQGRINEKIIAHVSDQSGGYYQTACLTLLGPDGLPTENGQRTCHGLTAIIEETLEQNGQHTLIVEEGSGRTMPYGLAMDRVAPTFSPNTPSLCFGCNISDLIDGVGDMDLYVINGASGDRIIVQATDQSGGYYQTACITLFGPGGLPTENGQRTCHGLTAIIEETLGQNGVHAILVEEGSGRTMPYLTDLQCINPPCGPTNGTVRCNGLDATIVGTEANDKIIGTDGPDVIHGLGGFDIIWGMGGDDVICGGDGTDNISGRDGNDIVLGGGSHDSIWGGPGNDIVEGGDGNDSIFGGPGNDTVRGNNGNDSLYGSSGVDNLYGGAGPDNNDTCYDTAGTFNLECEVFYEE